MKMVHTSYRVKDLDASLDFYKKAFNFSESRRRDFPEHKFTLVYLTLPGDSYELELTYNFDHAAYNLGDGYGHIAIATDNLEELHEKQKAAGFKVTDLYGLPGTPPSYYFISDPDGYDIEVIRSNY